MSILDDELLTVKELTQHFKCKPDLIYKWFERGLVKTKIGGMTRIKKSDLEKFISEGKA